MTEERSAVLCAKPIRGGFVALFVILLILLALHLAYRESRRRSPHNQTLKTTGGGVRKQKNSTNLVVDTLNLTHWMRRREMLSEHAPQDGAKTRNELSCIDVCDIIEAIAISAPKLQKSFPGRITYVTKDRESVFNSPRIRALYQATAKRNKVHIAVAEQYVAPPSSSTVKDPKKIAHSAQGRDDFFMSLLACRYDCAVLTNDRLLDFAEFRSTIPPFYVVEYTYWRANPDREYVRPESPGYRKLLRPAIIKHENFLS